MSKNTLQQVAEFIKQQQAVIVSAHVAPDADAIGSACGLALALSKAGKSAKVFFAEPIPYSLQKLIVGVSMLTEPPQAGVALICVDTATEKRISGYEIAWHKNCSKIINIDHHISNEYWGDMAYVDGTAPATAAIIAELLSLMELQPSAAVANLLYAGLMDDTGSFRFSNTTTDTFKTAIYLLEHGADPQFVANNLYYSVQFSLIKLRAKALEKMLVLCDGRLGFLLLTQEDLKQTGTNPSDTEGLVDEVRALADTYGAVFMRQLPDENAWKISLRSKRNDWDVGSLAAQFGGGGHKAAAGCRIDGTEKDAQKKLIAAIEQSFSKLSA